MPEGDPAKEAAVEAYVSGKLQQQIQSVELTLSEAFTPFKIKPIGAATEDAGPKTASRILEVDAAVVAQKEKMDILSALADENGVIPGEEYDNIMGSCSKLSTGNDADDDSSVIDGATPKAKRSKTAVPQREAYELRAKPEPKVEIASPKSKKPKPDPDAAAGESRKRSRGGQKGVSRGPYHKKDKKSIAVVDIISPDKSAPAGERAPRPHSPASSARTANVLEHCFPIFNPIAPPCAASSPFLPAATSAAHQRSESKHLGSVI